MFVSILIWDHRYWNLHLFRIWV